MVKIALDKALDFILKSQYYEGSWPQRYPVQNEFYPNEKPDYTTYHTFNDGVISNNLFFLLSCYTTLQNEKLLEPILKTMDFFIESIFSRFQNGWALQYDLEIKPASARTYEPASLDPQLSYRNCEMLLKFYQITGDERFLNIVPGVIKWIETVKLGDLNTDVIIVPKFVEVGSNKPLYVHWRGENTFFGNYYIDYKSGNEIIHYPSIRYLNLQLLKNEYERTKSIKVDPLSGKIFIPGLSNDLSSSEKLKITRNFFFSSLFGKNDEDLVSKDIVQNIVSELDEEGRWLTNNVFISNPYIGIPEEGDLYTYKYSTTFVGNSFDTSPYPNQSADKYISTSLYIRNMKSLINYLKKINL